jgi:hypothetical protein
MGGEELRHHNGLQLQPVSVIPVLGAVSHLPLDFDAHLSNLIQRNSAGLSAVRLVGTVMYLLLRLVGH